MTSDADWTAQKPPSTEPCGTQHFKPHETGQSTDREKTRKRRKKQHWNQNKPCQKFHRSQGVGAVKFHDESCQMQQKALTPLAQKDNFLTISESSEKITCCGGGGFFLACEDQGETTDKSPPPSTLLLQILLFVLRQWTSAHMHQFHSCIGPKWLSE